MVGVARMALTLEKPRTKGSKPGIAKARLAFLYGVNGNPPVVTTKELAVIAGTTEKAVWTHMAAWKAEAEKIAIADARAQSAITLRSAVLTLSDKVSESHSKDVEILRNNVDLLAAQLESCDKMTNVLFDFMKNMDDDKDYALRIFENFIRGVGARASIMKQFQSVRADWAKCSGMDAYSDVQVTAAKTLAQGMAKLELDNGSDKTEPGEGEMVSGFKRRG